VPDAWTRSAETPGYYGGGYRWALASPQASDAAVFAFRLDSAGTRMVEARWTAGTNRSSRATYVVIAGAGDTLGVVPVDQRTNGSVWRTLGSWTFPAGWSRVALLRRGSGGGVVVADAVRVRE
jgi:hypothetical protein